MPWNPFSSLYYCVCFYAYGPLTCRMWLASPFDGHPNACFTIIWRYSCCWWHEFAMRQGSTFKKVPPPLSSMARRVTVSPEQAGLNQAERILYFSLYLSTGVPSCTCLTCTSDPVALPGIPCKRKRESFLSWDVLLFYVKYVPVYTAIFSCTVFAIFFSRPHLNKLGVYSFELC